MSDELKFKGTPGPWKTISISGKKRVRQIISTYDGTSLLTILEEDTGVEFAVVWDDDDANLIKSSPNLLQFAIDCATNYDCDTDAHKYGTPCRKCEAERLAREALGLSSKSDNQE